MSRPTSRAIAVCGLVALAAAAVAQPPKQPKAKADDGPPQWVKEPVEARHLHYKKFHSKAVGGEVSYLIYLPAGYEADAERRYPVMYWLHGIGGVQTGVPRLVERFDTAVEAGKTPPMLV